MVVASIAGDAWRIALSFAVLGALPFCWYVLFDRMGAHGYGPARDVQPPRVENVIAAAEQGEAEFPLLHRYVKLLSFVQIAVLLAFGNLFLAYVVIRWGWGYSS